MVSAPYTYFALCVGSHASTKAKFVHGTFGPQSDVYIYVPTSLGNFMGIQATELKFSPWDGFAYSSTPPFISAQTGRPVSVVANTVLTG